MFKFLVKFLSALVMGVILALWITQNNLHVQKTLISKLITFLEHEWDSTITVQSQKINFFTASFLLEKGTVKSLKNNAEWKAETIKVHVSPWQLLFKKKIVLSLVLTNVYTNTGFHDDRFDIVDHLYDIFETRSDDFPVIPQTIRIDGIHIDTELFKKRVSTQLLGTFQIHKLNESAWRGSLALLDGSLMVDGKVMFKEVSGKTTFDKVDDQPWSFISNHQITYPSMQSNPQFSLKGAWNQKDHSLLVQHQDKLLDLGAEFQQKACSQVKVTGKFGLPLALSFYNFFQEERSGKSKSQEVSLDPALIEGDCLLDLTLNKEKQTLLVRGKATVQDCVYKKMNLGTCTFVPLTLNAHTISANIIYNPLSSISFTGSLKWNRAEEKGTLMLTNTTALESSTQQAHHIPYNTWIIHPQDFVLKTIIANKGGYKGVYKFFLSDKGSEETQSFKGNYLVTPEKFSIRGHTLQGEYYVEGKHSPDPYLTKFYYTHGQDILAHMSIKNKASKILEGPLNYTFIQSLFAQQVKRLILGRQNVLYLSIDQANLEQIKGAIHLEKGKFYIPESRNLIEKFSTTFLLQPWLKKVILNDVRLGFCKGSVVCPQALFAFDETFALKTAHMPLEINDLFINWKKDFYGFVYGTLAFSKFQQKTANIAGNLILKKSLLKDNIFSTELSGNLYTSDYLFDGLLHEIDLDLTLATEKPIKIRTPALETYANADIKIAYVHDQQAVHVPQVEGTIKLDGGALTFFRNKLNIEYGRIQFMANQMNDPLIDLMAKNMINKYLVSLQATGSLQKPNIVLESTPELTEEQILGLILAGSENATLQADLPGILMQNLHTILLGGKKTYSKSANFFEKIIKPLRYIHITPHFTDQSGRGGIRGVLAIDVNKQIRGKIQKNFTLQEDFTFEVEYFLSDDINLKAVKDERGELGSEVEMRFKF